MIFIRIIIRYRAICHLCTCCRGFFMFFHNGHQLVSYLPSALLCIFVRPPAWRRYGAFTRIFPLWPRLTWKLWCLWTLTDAPTLSKPSIVLLPFWTCCSCWTMLLLHSVGAFLFSMDSGPCPPKPDQFEPKLLWNVAVTPSFCILCASWTPQFPSISWKFLGTPASAMECNEMSCMYVMCVSMYV